MNTTMTTPAVLPPMLARMPKVVCRYGGAGYCGEPATSEMAEVIPELWIEGYCGDDLDRAAGLEALGRRLLAMITDIHQGRARAGDAALWEPFCDKHQAIRRAIYDRGDRPDAFLIERCLGLGATR